MRFLALTIATAMIVGCSAVAPGDGPVLPVESDGSIGDGNSRPMLSPMTYDELSKAIEAGTGCLFIARGNEDPIFAASAPDSGKIAGKGAIKINKNIVTLTHNGFGIAQVEAGGVFTNEAVLVRIEHPGGKPSTAQEDTYFWPAVLKIDQDEGGSNRYDGIYECGG
ncbi:MAG: hypothetical protein ABJO01_16105 [Parasphingorhabdus sp.]|uniref:hypothetical protein n=1 Tax=Parasphingorhabdus sp. TaxID=2709688 RepID=UPI003296B22C